MSDEERKHAWSKAKTAVRSYAKDPTTQNAKQVEDAWSRIRQMDSLSHWRERRAARLHGRDGAARSRHAE